MNRRNFLRTGAVLAGPSPRLPRQLNAAGQGPVPEDHESRGVCHSHAGRPVASRIAGHMPPIGTTTGGAGLWNRLDHASPSRIKGHTQAVLVPHRPPNQGLTGWGECHAPESPRVHQRIISDLFAPSSWPKCSRGATAMGEAIFHRAVTRLLDGVYTEALAGVDLALWDLLGRVHGYAGLPSPRRQISGPHTHVSGNRRRFNHSFERKRR